MTEWYADPKCLDSDDRPLSLPMHGRGPSLAKLIRRALPGDDPIEVAEALVTAKAVRRQGELYIPISRHVSFSEDLGYARAHSIGSLSGHVAAIQHNVSCKDPDRRVLEREVSNLHIPVRRLPEVHRFFRREGVPFLSGWDNFLTDLQVKPGSEPTVCVGATLVAYEDPWKHCSEEMELCATNQPAGVPNPVETNGAAGSAAAMPAIVAEAVESFVRVLSRFGVSQSDFISCARQEYFKLALTPQPPRVDAEPEIPGASHVMTVWHDDPRYTLNGLPRALARRGRAPSFRSLVRAVDVRLDPDTVLQYLIRSGSVQRRGRVYVALREAVILRGNQGPAIERSLRGIRLMLATTENNLMPESVAEGWIERTAENAAVPASRLGEWAAFLERNIMNLLTTANSELRRYELEARPGEPRLAAGVGAYRFQTSFAGVASEHLMPAAREQSELVSKRRKRLRPRSASRMSAAHRGPRSSE